MDAISDRLLERGKRFYEGGITMIKLCLILGPALLAFSLVSAGEAVGDVLTLQAYSTFTNILVAVAYLAILAGLFGIRLHFLGLHDPGLGQIAKNTDQ